MSHYVCPMLKHTDKTQDALKKLAMKGHWSDKEKFKKLKQIAADQTLPLPPSANLQKNNI